MAAAVKPLEELSAAEFVDELRAMSDTERRRFIVRVSLTDASDLPPFSRGLFDACRQLAEAVDHGRPGDVREASKRWGWHTRRIVKAANGKPDELKDACARSWLRELMPTFHDSPLNTFDGYLGPRGSDRWKRCLHEAAHAVVVEVLGATVESVTSGRLSGAGACCDYSTSELGEADLAVALAARALGAIRDDGPGELPYRGDVRRAQEIALELRGTDQKAADRLLEDTRRRVDELLIEHAVSVGAVAARLWREGELTGDQVREIIRDVTPTPTRKRRAAATTVRSAALSEPAAATVERPVQRQHAATRQPVECPDCGGPHLQCSEAAWRPTRNQTTAAAGPHR
jgi:hypothetical protein